MATRYGSAMAKLLVIDDDPQMRQMVMRVLAEAGHDVVVAKDGAEGLKQFREQQPAVVITDILMPEKEGIETIRTLRSEAPALRILAISGGGPARGMMFLNMAKEFGADATLSKPFRAAELVEAVQRLL